MNQEFLNHLDEYIKQKRYRLVNSVLVYENGELAFERYYNKFNPQKRNEIKSIWKSILSFTLGICLDNGLIRSLDEPISLYLKQFDGNNHPYHRLITIRHLLTMSSGIYWNGGVHYHCPMYEQMRRSKDWLSHLADIKMADYPGAKMVYKEWDVILLSAVIGKACGSSSWDYCEKYLYQPLEIASNQWTQSKCGIDFPSASAEDNGAAELSARDLAKIGQLALNGGLWNGRRILSNEYINEAVMPKQTNSDYGFLWWVSDQGYGGRGFGGQELNVYPDKKIVTVVQAAVTPSSKSYRDICENIVI